MQQQIKKILLTGGAGFIGSNLADSLLEDENNYITSIDNFDSFYERDVKEKNIQTSSIKHNYCFIEEDILNIDKNHTLNVSSFDLVIHIAAKAGVRPSILNPDLYHLVNVEGTRRILNWCRKKQINKVIFASSSSVYGVNQNFPWQESDKLIPISPYAETKLLCERMGQEYAEKYGLQFLALRFFTVYGPRQRPDLAISKFINLILNDQPIPLYGDGNTRRDYTYVDDVIQGIKGAINYNASQFEIINIGNHQSVSLKEMVSLIEEKMHKKAKINWLPLQEGDVPETYADISKAHQLLGYYPATNLSDGISNYLNWLSQTKNE